MSVLDSQWMLMPQQHTSWVRESYLFGCDEQPWVKAKISMAKHVYLSIFEPNRSENFYFNVPIRCVNGQKVGHVKVVILGMVVNLLFKRLFYLPLSNFCNNSIFQNRVLKDCHVDRATHHLAT
ncbi:unnamed protein product, partial [Oppiella nova]